MMLNKIVTNEYGSETTATTMANVLLYLAKHFAVSTNPQSLLDEAMPSGSTEWDYNKIKTISFIDEIIHETLYLRTAVMTGGYRITPAQGTQVDGVHFPGDMSAFVPVQAIQTDERYYKQSREFIPKRWGERKQELQVEDAPFMSFSLGG